VASTTPTTTTREEEEEEEEKKLENKGEIVKSTSQPPSQSYSHKCPQVWYSFPLEIKGERERERERVCVSE
jgi:hypothetical protein